MQQDYLMHHGILGQKWGIRRFQNFDGTLTPAGRERYGKNVQAYPEIKLKRQVLTVNMHKRGKYGKVYDEYKRYASKNDSDIWRNREAVESFLNKLAGAKLSDIGYEPSPEAIAYLRSRPWFNMPYDWIFDPSRRKSNRIGKAGTTFGDY